MKKMLLMGLMFFAVAAQAETISLKATCSANEEYGDSYGDDDEENDNSGAPAEGWTVTEDQYGDKAYEFSVTLSPSQLPFSRNIGSLEVSLSKEAVLSVGMSVGDADASAESSLELPRNGNKLVPFQKMVLHSSGGDHASGVWGYNCETEVSVR